MSTAKCSLCDTVFHHREAPGSGIHCPECGGPALTNAPPPSDADDLARRENGTGPAREDDRASGDGRSHPARFGSQGIVRHALVGILLTVAFYGAMFVLETHVPRVSGMAVKFTHRGGTPYVAVFLTCWSLSMLVGKLRNARRLAGALRSTLIPADLVPGARDRIAGAIEALAELPDAAPESVPGYRIRRALEHFLATGNRKEVGDILREESDVDFAEADASYALVRALLWAIPILGFVGTVLGVGAAVGGFAQFLGSAQEVDQIKNALSGVTSGLSVAFDTTFVALLLSLFVVMVQSSVQKFEFNQLRGLEEHCRAVVLRCIPASGDRRSDPVAGAIREVADRMTPAIEVWKTEAQSAAEAIRKSLIAEWHEAAKAWSGGIPEVVRSLQENRDFQETALESLRTEREQLVRDARDQVRMTTEMLVSERTAVQDVLRQERAAITASLEEQQETARRYSQALLDAASGLRELVALQRELESQLVRSNGSDGLVGVLRRLDGSLTSLAPSIRRLTEEPIGVQVELVAARAGVGNHNGNGKV